MVQILTCRGRAAEALRSPISLISPISPISLISLTGNKFLTKDEQDGRGFGLIECRDAGIDFLRDLLKLRLEIP